MKFSKASFASFAAPVFALTLGLTVAGCDGRKDAKEANFTIQSVGLENTEVIKTDSYGLPETKRFKFKACLKDENTRSGISTAQFLVSDGHNDILAVTDSSGCLNWSEIHSYSELQPAKTVRIVRTFKPREFHSGTQSVELAFNPWQETLVDLRWDTDLDVEEKIEVLGFDSDFRSLRYSHNTFVVAAMSDMLLGFIGHDMAGAVITPTLRLKPAQKFRLTFKPHFIRYNLRNEPSYIDMKGGRFKMSLIVLAENASLVAPKARDIVAYAHDEMNVQAKGLAQKDIVLRINDISGILSRNQFILIMEPTDSAANFARSAIYKGFVGPLNGNSALVDLIPYEGNSPQVISSIKNAMIDADKTVDPMELLQTKSGLQQEKEGSALASLMGSTDNANMVVNVLRSYCERLYTPDETTLIPQENWLGKVSMKKVKTLETCRKSPATFVTLEKRSLVKDVLDKPRLRSDLLGNKEIQLSKDLKYTKSEKIEDQRAYSLTYGWSASGSLSFDVLKALSFIPGVSKVISAASLVGVSADASAKVKGAIGTDWLSSENLTTTSETGFSAAITESYKFTVNSIGFDLKVRTQDCLVLTAAFGSKGYFTCSSTTQDRMTTETYYQVNHDVGNSVFSDSQSAESSMWRITIRGNDNYKAFENLMTKGNGVLKFSELKISDKDAALFPDFKVNQSFPGVISSK